MRVWTVLLCISSALCGAAFAETTSIHRMVVGDRVLALQDTLQLTTRADGKTMGVWISPNGKYVAYLTGTVQGTIATTRVCVVPSAGGRPSVVFESAVSLESTPPADLWTPNVSAECSVAWSPDGKLIAIPLQHDSYTPDGNHSDNLCIMVVTSAGMRRGLFELPSGTLIMDDIRWSPDSRRIACTAYSHQTDGSQTSPVRSMFVCDMQRAACEQVISRQDGLVQLDSWSPDGKALRYYVRPGKPGDSGKGAWQYREFQLESKSDVLVREAASIPKTSPDGRMRLSAEPGLCIQDCASEETKVIFKPFTGTFVGWTPDSRMLVYQQPVKIPDQSGKRYRELNSLWLAVPAEHRLNHMCVALDADKDSAPSFSSDCTRLAYVCQGRVCVAQLGWTEPDFAEKLAAGIPLTEDEQKLSLTNSAKQIGTAAFMYAADHGDKFPSESYADELGPYFGGADMFGSLGPNVTFQFTPLGSASGVKDPSNTVMGVFDAGYQWQVILYADGHAKVVPKTK